MRRALLAAWLTLAAVVGVGMALTPDHGAEAARGRKPKPTTTVATTTTVPPTTTTVPTTTTTLPGSCPSTDRSLPGGPDGFGGCWPSAATTGVPAGTTLTVVNGNVNVNVAGTVIDAKDIRGCVSVTAANVTIRRSRVLCSGGYAVDVYNVGASLTIEDSEVTCGNSQGTGIGERFLTVLRVDVWGCENGLDVDSDTLIEDSYVHDLYEGTDGHADGLQTCCNTRITIRHNTLFPGAQTTSAIITPPAAATDLTVNRNLMAGGAATIYCRWVEAGATATRVAVTENRWSRYFYPNGGAFMPHSTCDPYLTPADDNRWADTLALLT